MLNIGCHLSISKGYENMGKETLEIEANTFQFFTRNPRGGKIKELNVEDINNLLELMKKNNFSKILAHAPYTTNLCSDKEDIREFAKNMMKEDLERMEYLPGNMYNFHPGSHVGQGVEQGIEYIAKALNEVLIKNQSTTVLLETMAGKGTEIGRSFEELKTIIDKVSLKEKLGVCLDTCHINDAGYDVSDIDKVFNMPGGKEKYWEQVILDVCKNNYKIHVRECDDGDIIEIDTFNELKQIDKSYDCYKKVRK